MSNNPTITAAEFNAIAAYYNDELGTNIANVAVGDAISASLFTDMWDEVKTTADLMDKWVALPPREHFVVGSVIHKEMWGEVGDKCANTVAYDYNGSYTIPAGITSVVFHWIVGGGGGGGAGTEIKDGGGGGGGGSGGFHHNVSLPVKTGDKLTWTIGAAGAGAAGVPQSGGNAVPNAASGGDTIVYLNSQEKFRAGGGKAGASAGYNDGSANEYAAGGLGGSPNGLSGQAGPPGQGDYASSYGAGGAPGPISGSFGGAGGNKDGGDPMGSGPSCGKPGVGYGSGGGGGGSKDRSNGKSWAGGAGVKGYVEFTPGGGLSCGSPAADNSGYSTVITGEGGGGYTGTSPVSEYLDSQLEGPNTNGDQNPF